MGKTIRSAPVYVKSRKIAEVTSGTYDHASGDEMQLGSEGYIGHSDGIDTCRMQISTIVPTAGHALDLRRIILNKEYVVIGLPIDGGFESWEGRLVSRSYKWDNKTGVCTGDFSIEGGKPEVF